MFQLVISVLGPLHVSLNTRELVVKQFIDSIWLKFYQAIFGPGKKLAKTPKLWRISLILELAQGGWNPIRQSVRTIFGDCCDAEYCLLLNFFDELVPAALDVYSTFFRANDFLGYLHCLLRLETMLIQPMQRKNYKKNSACIHLRCAFLVFTSSNSPFSDFV
eukprot:Pompholyxophrys_punicea_v1_NODE_460_length_1909_cov_7.339266.p2 type:complete len:162 gc:universal NODE_460_length_1909_cov_7.339266:670-185(-)